MNECVAIGKCMLMNVHVVRKSTPYVFLNRSSPVYNARFMTSIQVNNKVCILQFLYGSKCNEANPCSQNSGISRIQTIVNASLAYGDGQHMELEKQIAENANLKNDYHKNCLSRDTADQSSKISETYR